MIWTKLRSGKLKIHNNLLEGVTVPKKKRNMKNVTTVSPYTFEQEEMIEKLVAEAIQNLQHLVHDKRGLISDWQLVESRCELEQYQELQYQNRLNRQINIKRR